MVVFPAATGYDSQQNSLQLSGICQGSETGWYLAYQGWHGGWVTFVACVLFWLILLNSLFLRSKIGIGLGAELPEHMFNTWHIQALLLLLLLLLLLWPIVADVPDHRLWTSSVPSAWSSPLSRSTESIWMAFLDCWSASKVSCLWRTSCLERDWRECSLPAGGRLGGAENVEQKVRLKRAPTYRLAILHDFAIMSVPRHHVQKLCLAGHIVVTNTTMRPWKNNMLKIFGLEAPVESCQGVILPWTKRRNVWNIPEKVWRQAFQDSDLGCDLQSSSLVLPYCLQLKDWIA